MNIKLYNIPKMTNFKSILMNLDLDLSKDFGLNIYRKDAYNVFLNIINDNMDIPSIEKINIALSLEKGCYNASEIEAKNMVMRIDWNNDFINLYKNIVRRVLKNIDPTSEVGSTYLLDSIKNGEISPISIGSMHPNSLCPQRNINIINYTDKQRNEIIKKKVSNLYKCPKCRTNNSTVEEVQCRALDEGTNTRITCMTCGWKYII